MPEREFFDEAYAELAGRFEQIKEDIKQLEQKDTGEMDISAGYAVINRETIPFERRKLISAFSIIAPKTFTIMKDAYAKTQYPSINVMQNAVILTDESMSVNLCFAAAPAKIAADDARENRDFELAEITAGQEGNIRIHEKGDVAFEGGQAAYFDMTVSDSADGCYCLMFFFMDGDELIEGAFRCPASGYAEWKTAARQMIESVKILEKRSKGFQSYQRR